MSLHADVAVPARDRKRLERLCRYVARPPLALDRLAELGDGRLAYRLKTPWRDGTTHVVMERWELLERLAPLIPPPRSHQVRYHGVLAPCASGRDRVVPGAGVVVEGGSLSEDPTARSGLGAGAAGSATSVPQQEATTRAGIVDQGSVGGSAPPIEVVPDWAWPSLVAPSTSAVRDPGSQSAKNVDPPRRTAWADLLQRVFEVDALRCPECGGRMRILSAITEPDVARRILACLDLPSRAPPLGSYTRTGELDDGESATELTGGEWGESAGFDFDQSLPDDGRSAPTADPQRRMVPRDLPRFGRRHSLVLERSIPGANVLAPPVDGVHAYGEYGRGLFPRDELLLKQGCPYLEGAQLFVFPMPTGRDR